MPSAPKTPFLPASSRMLNLARLAAEGRTEDNGLRGQVIAALRQVFDPELPVNIYDLGLIYALNIDAAGQVRVSMTLTAPGCPVAQTFPAQVEQAINAVAGVADAHVEIVWEPPWDQSRMTEAARLQLGLM